MGALGPFLWLIAAISAQPSAPWPNAASFAQPALNIGPLVAPCAARYRPLSAQARSFILDLRVTVSRQGRVEGHEIVAISGVTDANRHLQEATIARSLQAVNDCASRIATLPPEHYARGWRTFRYRFRFP